MKKIEAIEKNWQIKAPDNENIRLVLANSPQYYKKRLQKIGFVGQKTKILDAGCGAGHWSLAASYLNSEVKGIDATAKYLRVAKKIKTAFGRQNIDLCFGKNEQLPYPDNHFDFIVSYCAWMYTDRPRSLKEMSRVLKTGGKIYLGAVAGLGWYLDLIWQGITEGKKDLILESLKAIQRKINTSENETRKLLAQCGLKIIDFGSDGQIGDPKIKVKPCYKDKIWGFWNVFEVLAEESNRKEK